VTSIPPSFDLRPETATDEPLLRALYASTRADELALVNWDQATRERFIESQFQAQRSGYFEMFPRGEFSIVLVQGVPAGRVVVNRTAFEIRLVDLVIAPALRNRGIGTELTRRLLDESRATSRPVRLHVLTHSPARRLYERLGFVVREQGDVYTEMEYSAASAAT